MFLWDERGSLGFPWVPLGSLGFLGILGFLGFLRFLGLKIVIASRVGLNGYSVLFAHAFTGKDLQRICI